MNIQPMTEEDRNTPLPEAPDLSQVPDDELDDALSKIQEGEDPQEARFGAEDEPEEDEPTEEITPVETPEVKESDQPEPQAASEDAPQSEEDAPAEPDPQPEATLEEIQARLELSDLKSDKAATEAERWRYLADRNAGELAHIKQKLTARELSQAPDTGDYSRETGYDELPGVNDQRPAVMPAELREELSEVRSERVTRAIQNEGSRFNERHRDFWDYIQKQDEAEITAFNADFNELLAANAKEFESGLTGTDPKLAAVTSRTVYDSALVDARIKMKERQLEAIRSGKSEAKAALLEQKKAAAPTTGQTPLSPEAPDDNKPLSQMSDKEFNKVFRRTFR